MIEIETQFHHHRELISAEHDVKTGSSFFSQSRKIESSQQSPSKQIIISRCTKRGCAANPLLVRHGRGRLGVHDGSAGGWIRQFSRKATTDANCNWYIKMPTNFVGHRTSVATAADEDAPGTPKPPRIRLAIASETGCSANLSTDEASRGAPAPFQTTVSH